MAFVSVVISQIVWSVILKPIVQYAISQMITSLKIINVLNVIFSIVRNLRIYQHVSNVIKLIIIFFKTCLVFINVILVIVCNIQTIIIVKDVISKTIISYHLTIDHVIFLMASLIIQNKICANHVQIFVKPVMA